MRIRIESIGISNSSKKMGSIKHAVKAGEKCFYNSSYTPRDVDIIINTGIHRDKHFCEPALAAIIQNDLGINPEFQGRKSFSFDLVNGGCGMLNAIQIIDCMLKTGKNRVGMVVSSEANADKKPSPNYTYPNSGAALILDISPKKNIGFGNFVFKSYDKYLDYYTSVIELFQKNGKLAIDKKDDIDDAYLECVSPSFEELLEKEKLNKEQIDFVIPSQISNKFLTGLKDKLGLPEEKIINVMELIKFDTLTTSPFIALNHAMEEGIIKEGQKLVILTVGSGITVGSSIYYI